MAMNVITTLLHERFNFKYICFIMIIQYKKSKTLALFLGRVLVNRILSCTCYSLKCRRCIKKGKSVICPLYTERRLRLKQPWDLIIYFISLTHCIGCRRRRVAVLHA